MNSAASNAVLIGTAALTLDTPEAVFATARDKVNNLKVIVRF